MTPFVPPAEMPTPGEPTVDAPEQPGGGTVDAKHDDGHLHLVALIARHRNRARVVVSVVSLLVLVAFVAPDLDDVRHALEQFSSIEPGWLALAAWAQVSAIMASARFQRRLLRAGGVRLPLREAAAVVAADTALALSVSGGTILGAGYVQRYATRKGGNEGLVTTVAWLAQLLSAALLGAVVVVGASHPLWSPLPLASTLAALGAVAVLVLAVQRPFVVASFTAPVLRRVPGLGSRCHAIVHTQADRLSQLTLTRRDWATVLWLGSIVAVAEAVCLGASARAVHLHPGVSTIILGYAAVQTALAFPITPGAVGIVESALWGTAVARHIHRIAALTWTLLYRALSYWAVLVVGWSCYLLLQRMARKRAALVLARSTAGTSEPEVVAGI
jgi:uncharacterized membrane protein YbhN (UPF0104 family)